VTAGVRGDRPTRALTPPELLRGLATGTDEERADGGRDPRSADAGWRRGAAIAVLAVAGAGALATSGRVAIGSGANFSESAVISRVASRADGSMEAQGDSAVRTRKFGTDALRGAVVAAALTAGATAQDAVQWRVEDGGNGHWYRGIRATSELSWTQARDLAASVGGHLVTVTTDAEYQVVHGIAGDATLWNGRDGPWLGGYQDRTASDYSEPAGGWRWVTGERWFPKWGVGEPSDVLNIEDYLHYIASDPGSCAQNLAVRHWNDFPNIGFDTCTPTPIGLIAEWSADCNSDGIVDYGQIRAGQLPDANANNVPDGCECSSFPELPVCRCVGDIVADRIVNGADLGTLLSYWGPRTSGSFSIASDLDDNGRIDGADLGMLLSNWGECQPAAVIVPPWATLIEAAPDPAVVTDPTLRAAITATGLAWRVRDTGTGIELLLVPPGTFQMGCSASTAHPCNSMELPAHPVTITRAFYLGRYEVTQAQWFRRTGTNPSYFQHEADSPSRPVDRVSWHMASNFATSAGMRLPSEAEWEFACRGGTSTAFCNGTSDDSTVGDFAWWNGNADGQSHAVGTRQSNQLGFFDMLGNTWEWVNDWYADYSQAPQTDPAGPSSGTERCIRGSTWFGASTSEFRSSYRGRENPSIADYWRGFRIARNP
jgi:formylglycine-generating enzyme required for sulfatase activity